MLLFMTVIACTLVGHVDISFSADHEDILVRRWIFERLGVVRGRYIDVGANHAFLHSNSKLFHTLGWNGVVVDPSLVHIRTHIADREGDIHLRNAVSSETLKRMKLWSSGQLASLEPSNKHDKETEQVLTVSLGDICKRILNNTIDLLSIDVERHELTVLNSVDLRTCRPKALIIEVLSNKDNIEKHLKKSGYRVFATIGFNVVYVPEELTVGRLPTPADIKGLDALHAAVILRDAISLGHVNHISYTGPPTALPLKSCWWDQHKSLNFAQRHLKPECMATTFNTVFLRDHPDSAQYYTYTCGSDNKVLVVGNHDKRLGFKDCAAADLKDYVTSVKVVTVATRPSTLLEFKDSGSVLLWNYTASLELVDRNTVLVGSGAGGPSKETQGAVPRFTAHAFQHPTLGYLPVFGMLVAGVVAFVAVQNQKKNSRCTL
eukprot:TRINITY_DN37724_c0_g1_i1.p1 TRINITY_DN37724_c0_g1~~TRINITY_DN37724_c0_g1_i1.p1  ORF type:complete len:451 (+),score=98.90 TRINITY_DN37724_c0_g1_i1:57-1355(+)